MRIAALILTFLLNFAGRTAYDFTGIKMQYFYGDSLSWCAFIFYAYLAVKGLPTNKEWERELISWLAVMLVYNLYKDFLQRATEFDATGYLLLMILSSKLVYRIYVINNRK